MFGQIVVKRSGYADTQDHLAPAVPRSSLPASSPSRFPPVPEFHAEAPHSMTAASSSGEKPIEIINPNGDKLTLTPEQALAMGDDIIPIGNDTYVSTIDFKVEQCVAPKRLTAMEGIELNLN